MASWLVRWTPDGAAWVRALARALSCVLGQDTLLSQQQQRQQQQQQQQQQP